MYYIKKMLKKEKNLIVINVVKILPKRNYWKVQFLSAYGKCPYRNYKDTNVISLANISH